MALRRKTRLSTHNELSSHSHHDSLLPESAASLPELSCCVRRRLVCARERASTSSSSPSPSLSKTNTRPCPFRGLALSLSALSAVFSHSASVSPSGSQLRPTTLSAGISRNSVRQAAFSTDPTQNSRLAVLHKEDADVKEALISRKTVSALGEFEKRVQHLEDENSSFKEFNHELK